MGAVRQPGLLSRIHLDISVPIFLTWEENNVVFNCSTGAKPFTH
jgi:hypothetical protein